MQLIQQQSFFMKKMMQLIQLHVFILEGPPGAPGPRPLRNKKNEKNKANGNGNAHANFDWYFLVLFFKMV